MYRTVGQRPQTCRTVGQGLYNAQTCIGGIRWDSKGQLWRTGNRDNLSVTYSSVPVLHQLIRSIIKLLWVVRTKVGRRGFNLEAAAFWCPAGELEHSVLVSVNQLSRLVTKCQSVLVSICIIQYRLVTKCQAY